MAQVLSSNLRPLTYSWHVRPTLKAHVPAFSLAVIRGKNPQVVRVGHKWHVLPTIKAYVPVFSLAVIRRRRASSALLKINFKSALPALINR